MLLVNAPVPAPLVVQVSALVGAPVVFQQMPRAETGKVPWVATFPPPKAVVEVIFVIPVVVMDGKDAVVAKII